MTLGDFRKRVMAWVLNDYALSIHSELHALPITVWNDGILANPPSLPRVVEDLDILLQSVTTRALTREGIKIFGLTYSGHSRHRLLLNHPDKPSKCVVRYSTSDIGSIYLLDWVTNQYLRFECTNPGMAGVPLEQWNIAAERARRLAKDQEAIYADTVLQQRAAALQETAELRKRGKGRGRKVARVMQSYAEQPLTITAHALPTAAPAAARLSNAALYWAANVEGNPAPRITMKRIQ